MGSITTRIKPISGFSHFIHIALLILLPSLVFVFVSLHFYELATALILLSKWRMLAVKPRHWLANLRANAIDITVGLSLLIFMINSGSQAIHLIFAVAYAVWLIVLKPRSDQLSVMLQAMVGQTVGLFAIFLHWGDASLYILVGLVWVVTYSAARHFFASFEEPMSRFLSSFWGYFTAALTWLLGHWLIFYGVIAQPTLLISVIGFSLCSVYYLDRTDRLSMLLRRQLIFGMMAVVAIVLLFSGWGNKAV